MVRRAVAEQLDLLSMVRTTSRSRIHVARKPSGEVAAERLYWLLCEMGQDYNECEYGWKAEVARRVGLNYHTALNVIWAGERGDLKTIATKTVDQVATNTGIPLVAFYDSEYRK